MSAISPAGSTGIDWLDGACDGSFVVSGSCVGTLPTSFQRGDGTTIELGPPSPEPGGRRPDCHFLARFDRDGHAIWASSFWTGLSGGTGEANVPRFFPDGSVTLGGYFGTRITLGVGQPRETTLTFIDPLPHAYIARYGADGALLWAKAFSTDPAVFDNSIAMVATAPDLTSYAVIETFSGNGLVVGPGELDLALADNDRALVALDRDGHLTRGVRFQNTRDVENPRLTVLPDGDLLMVSTFLSGTVLAPGTPREITVSESSIGYLRLTSSLEPKSLTQLNVPADAYYSTPLPDGSVVFAGTLGSEITLGAGEPNAVTFKPTSVSTLYGFVARFASDGRLMTAVQLTHRREINLTASTALPDGSTWVVGYVPRTSLPEPITLGPGTARPLTLTADATNTVFVARFNPDGTPAWGTTFSGDTFLHFTAMTASPLSAVLVGTKEIGPITFGKGGPVISDAGAVIVRLGP